MKKSRISTLALMVGLLLTLVGMGGCAPAGEGGAAGMMPLILILALIFGMFYFLMIRPMRQREKKHDLMVSDLRPGDKVITAGGIYGRVEKIDENSVVIKVESGATLRVTKGGVISRPED